MRWKGILTVRDIIMKAAKPVALRVDAPDLALAGQPVTVHVTPAEPTRHAIRLAVTSETGMLIEARRIRPSGGPVPIGGLGGHAYIMDVAGTDSASSFAPVSSDILIWENPEIMPGAG
jgi:hypothetical protein